VPLKKPTVPPPSERLNVALRVTIRLAVADDGERDKVVVVGAGVGRARAKL